MPDTSSTIHPQLAAHAQAYFAAAGQLPSSPAPVVTAGVYVDNDGTRFTGTGGASRTPDYVLRVAQADGSRNGDTVSFDGVSVAAADTSAVGLLVLEDRGDAAQGDSKSALETLLQPYGSDGSGWATAIADATDRKARFERAIADIDGVPPNAPADDEVILIAYLVRHFTYDGSGAYYQKWQHPDDDSRRNFPNDLHADYKQKALVETKLDKDNFYCYSVVTSGSGSSLPARESIIRIKMNPDGTADLETIYEATRTETEARNEHCFFYAHAGLNIAVPESARGTLSPELAYLGLERPVAEIVTDLRADEDNAILDATGSKLLVSGIVRPNAPLTSLPQGVEVLDGDPGDAPPPAGAEGEEDEEATFVDNLQDHVRSFWCPLDKLVELSAHQDILVLHRVVKAQYYNTTARTTLNHAAFAGHIGGPVGHDVFIGVVDSGIDGNHPAFAGRIHKVWDQNAPANASHPPPTGTGFNFGQVWDTDADIQANSTDDLGHGTHVAGTAAGAVGTGFTEAGMAPAAKILAVKLRGFSNDITRGVEWCFREAGDKPCVVNLSLGINNHAFDGVDDLSLSIRRTFRRRNRGSSGYHWLPGRVVCVATGNAGDCRGHTHVDSLANNATTDFPVVIAQRTDPTGAVVPIPAARVRILARPLPRNVRGARIDVRVRRQTAAGPAASKWFTYVPNGAPDADVIGGTLVRVVNGPPPAGDPLGLVYTQHQLVEVILFDPSATGIPLGNWTIEVRSRTAANIQVDAYIPENVGQRLTYPVFFQNATKRSLVGSPATCYGAVAVGSMVNRASWTSQTAFNGTNTQNPKTPALDPATNLVTGTNNSVAGAISSFTCPGPVRGTRRTIRAMVPGEAILSAMASQGAPPNVVRARLFRPPPPSSVANVVDANTGQMSGTSMASPVVAGLVAGMLGKHPTLTAKQVIQKMEAAAGTAPAGWDADLYGPGPLDASKLLR